MRRDPLPASELGQTLCELFGTYRWSFLELHDGHSNWKTETRYQLKHRTLWQRWQDPAVQIGVRFGSETRYAVIDIDKGSQYLTTAAIAGIREALETIGIVRSIPIRSSWSDGLHLYLPLPESVKTFNLAVALKVCLQAHGFDIADGQLEIMPNVKSYGRPWLKEFVEYQGHRLPLQPGSGSQMLNEQFQPVSNKLERFFWVWDFAANQQDLELLHSALAAARNKRRRHKTCHTPFSQWRTDLEEQLQEGWTDFGQTNHLLKSIGTYGRVFLQKAGEELATYIEEKARSLPGFNQWCQHTHEIAKRALSWARSIENLYFPAGEEAMRQSQQQTSTDDDPKPDGNKARSWDAQRRITHATYELLHECRQSLVTVSDWAKAIVQRAKCSYKTLYRYREIWHPNHSDVQKAWDEGHVIPCLTSDLGQDPDFGSDHNPYLAITPDRLIENPFTHLGGGMKSIRPETSALEKLIPGKGGGVGGGRGFPQPDRRGELWKTTT